MFLSLVWQKDLMICWIDDGKVFDFDSFWQNSGVIAAYLMSERSSQRDFKRYLQLSYGYQTFGLFIKDLFFSWYINNDWEP